MWLITSGLVLLIICFGGVLLYGAPYLPTLTAQVNAALKLAALQPGDTLLELGCGDGKVLIAAGQLGLKAIGYELNPMLALLAWLRTRRYKGRVQVRWANFWWVVLPPAEAIFVFLLPKYMARLDKKIRRDAKQPVRLVSFAFKVPGRDIDKEQAGVYLYRYV